MLLHCSMSEPDLSCMVGFIDKRKDIIMSQPIISIDCHYNLLIRATMNHTIEIRQRACAFFVIDEREEMLFNIDLFCKMRGRLLNGRRLLKIDDAKIDPSFF